MRSAISEPFFLGEIEIKYILFGVSSINEGNIRWIIH